MSEQIITMHNKFITCTNKNSNADCENLKRNLICAIDEHNFRQNISNNLICHSYELDTCNNLKFFTNECEIKKF